jgi:hypothetical protein
MDKDRKDKSNLRTDKDLKNRRVSTSLRPVVMEFREFFHLC